MDNANTRENNYETPQDSQTDVENEADEANFTEHQITSYEDLSTIDDKPRVRPTHKPAHVMAMTSDMYELRDILSRQVLVGNLLWQSTDIVGAVIGTVNFPSVFFNDCVVKNKLANYRYLRYTLNLRFQVSGSPMNIGKAISFLDILPDQRVDNPTPQSRTSWTQIPHVSIDACGTTRAVMSQPYVDVHPFYDMSESTYNNYILKVAVFNPLLVASGTNFVHIKVFAWMTDVSVSIATASTVEDFGMRPLDKGQIPDYLHTRPFPPQNRKRNKMRSLHLLSKGEKKLDTITIDDLQPCSEADIVPKDPLAVVKNVPIIGSVLRDGLALADSIGNAIDWVEPLIKGASSVVGLDKVVNPSAAQPISQIPGRHFTTCDGVLDATVLGAYAKNTLGSSISRFGTSLDEMSIPNIISRRAFVQSVPWTTGNSSGDILATFPVHPGMSVVDTLGTALFPTPLSYVSSLFQYWRGTINFDIEVVSNFLLQGVLGVAFFPGSIAPVPPFSNCLLSSCVSHKFEIRGSKVVGVSVPFVSDYPYLLNRLWAIGGTGPFAPPTNKELITGFLVIYVENPMKGNTTVPASSYINVYISGAEDLQFALPTDCNYELLPTDETLKNSLPKEDMDLSDLCPCSMSVATSGKHNATSKQKNYKRISLINTKESMNPLAQMLHVAVPLQGELTTHLAQLKSRATLVTESQSVDTDHMLRLDPLFTGRSEDFLDSIANYISNLYLLSVGSTVWTLTFTQSSAGVAQKVYVGTQMAPSTVPPTGPTIVPFVDLPNFNFESIYSLDLNPIITVVQPFYCRVLSDVVSNTWSRPRPLLYIRADSDVVIDVRHARGSDFRAGLVWSAPLLRIASL